MSDDDEFFVGYLPTPPRTKRFAVALAIASLALVGGVAALGAASTTSPGAGVTPFATGTHLVGLLQAHPYGILWTIDESDPARVRGVLVVRGGKFGFPREAEALDGRIVAIEGGLLDREGHRMIELARLPEASAIDPAVESRLRALTRAAHEGEVVLAGEIVDSKCYLGRMRPGGGRTHRACAQLCVAGGIPPVLVTRDDAGHEAHYVLVGEDGSAIGRELLPYLAEPVEVRGTLERIEDVGLLRIDPTDVRRL